MWWSHILIAKLFGEVQMTGNDQEPIQRGILSAVYSNQRLLYKLAF